MSQPTVTESPSGYLEGETMTMEARVSSARRDPASEESEAKVVQLFPEVDDDDRAPGRETRRNVLRRRRWAQGQDGMATAEYAIATLGAVAFAGLLVVILRSDEVRGFLLNIIRSALSLP
jgi:hypothetical protein